MLQLGYAIAEGQMAYIRETEEFDQERFISSVTRLTKLGDE